MKLTAGQQVGRYTILRALGSGGMADVYEAADQMLERRIAVKVLPTELSRDPDLIQRFEKEVRAAAALDHAGIVTIYEVGHVDGIYFYTMRLLTGGDLRQRIRQGIEESEAIELIYTVADAFQHAHEQGFVHRDVKPENIMFDDRGRPVLTDFGIAKAMAASTKLTATGVMIGTPRYISPEQARGQGGVDQRADIYSLGVILFEMLAGRRPYEGDEALAIILQHLTAPIPRLPEAFSRYQALIDSLLAKDPAQRPESCDVLRDLLEPFRVTQITERGRTRGQRRKPAIGLDPDATRITGSESLGKLPEKIKSPRPDSSPIWPRAAGAPTPTGRSADRATGSDTRSLLITNPPADIRAGGRTPVPWWQRALRTDPESRARAAAIKFQEAQAAIARQEQQAKARAEKAERDAEEKRHKEERDREAAQRKRDAEAAAAQQKAEAQRQREVEAQAQRDAAAAAKEAQRQAAAERRAEQQEAKRQEIERKQEQEARARAEQEAAARAEAAAAADAEKTRLQEPARGGSVPVAVDHELPAPERGRSSKKILWWIAVAVAAAAILLLTYAWRDPEPAIPGADTRVQQDDPLEGDPDRPVTDGATTGAEIRRQQEEADAATRRREQEAAAARAQKAQEEAEARAAAEAKAAADAKAKDEAAEAAAAAARKQQEQREAAERRRREEAQEAEREAELQEQSQREAAERRRRAEEAHRLRDERAQEAARIEREAEEAAEQQRKAAEAAAQQRELEAQQQRQAQQELLNQQQREREEQERLQQEAEAERIRIEKEKIFRPFGM